MTGDCWIGLSLDSDSGLILAARVGKHIDSFIEELVNSTIGKTDCLNWKTDGWGGPERVLKKKPSMKLANSTPNEGARTNGIVRQHTGRWHRLENKFAKVWEQTKATARLVVSYFNWIWVHSRLGTTAAQRAGLTENKWTWDNFVTYPTVI